MTGGRDKPISGVNIAPIINLALIVVIIMMIASPILSLPDIDISLPTASAEDTMERNITVTLAGDGVVAVNEKIVDHGSLFGEISGHLADGGCGTLLVIRGDESVFYGRVEEILNLVKDAGFTGRIAIAVKKETDEP